MMRAARLLTQVSTTLAVAFGCGYVIQNGEEAAAQIGRSLQAPGMARASTTPDDPLLPRPPLATLQATPLPTTYGWDNGQTKSQPLGLLDRSGIGEGNQVQAKACTATLRAQPAPGGLVRVNLVAPCLVEEPVTLRHAGLSFAVRTTDKGRMTVEIPALTADAMIEAVLPNGQKQRAKVTVSDAVDYQRVALVWRGDAGLHIHAHEFGAANGSPGHIWAGSPGSADLGQNAQHGHLTTLGDRQLANATRAEVYTFPASAVGQSGVVRLNIQAEVRNTNCGGMIAAQTLQPDGLGGMVTSDITLKLPDCDRIGEQMVLDNILRDLKIASR